MRSLPKHQALVRYIQCTLANVYRVVSLAIMGNEPMLDSIHYDTCNTFGGADDWDTLFSCARKVTVCMLIHFARPLQLCFCKVGCSWEYYPIPHIGFSRNELMLMVC